MASNRLPPAPCAPAKHRAVTCSFRARFELLETRVMPAVLGLGIQLRANNDVGTPADTSDDQPGAIIANGTPIETGDLFWVDVLVEDKRETPQGVISLPINFHWDPAKLELTDPPTAPAAVPAGDLLLTDDFVLQRFVDSFDADGGHVGFPDSPPATIPIPADPNIEGLRGAAAPSVPDSGSAIATTSAGGFFSQLQFRALAAVSNTPFTIELAGSMSFADAEVLDGVAALTSPTVRQQRSNNAAPMPNQEELAVTEFIEIVEPPTEPELGSLSGYVYVDTNPLNGILDRNAGGIAVEFGIPNVTISLFRSGVLIDTTTTGADGGYLFNDLEPGLYRIVETQPALFITSASSVGTILPAGNPSGTAGADEILNIQLGTGQHGVDYNFGEVPIPDKRMFLARTDMREILAGQRGVAARTVNGTASNDTIVVEALSSALSVTINSQAPRLVPLSSARILYLDSGAGQDTVEFLGTVADELVNLAPGTGTMRLGEDYQGDNFAVMAIAAAQVIADGGTGNDLAIFRDSPANDALVAAGSAATLTALDNRVVQALAFEQARALSLIRPGVSDQDTVDEGVIDYVLETVGKWTLV